MDAIRILRGCGASGQSLAAGSTHTVPVDVSMRDAELLVRLGKAQWVLKTQEETNLSVKQKVKRVLHASG